MANKNRRNRPFGKPTHPLPSKIGSLLDVMEDDNEYGSIVGKQPSGLDLISELQRSLAEVDSDGRFNAVQMDQAIAAWLHLATRAEVRKGWRKHWGPLPAWAKED